MRLKRPRLTRFLLLTGIGITSLFALSTVFSFGISSHRRPDLSWDKSTGGFGIVQVFCGWGQFNLTVDFGPLRPLGRAPPPPRAMYAGIDYNPHWSVDVRVTDRIFSKIGMDVAGIRSGKMWIIGVFGLYPMALAWILWWFARSAKLMPGHCDSCGYDMRATPERCPECGTVAKAPKASNASVQQPHR
jgi:hypothetical protein